MSAAAGAPARIRGLRKSPVDGERIAGFHVDTPQAGDTPIGHAVTTSGWVVSSGEAIEAIEVVYRGEAIGQTSIDIERPDVRERFPETADQAPGWATQFSTLGLPAEFEVFVRAVFADGSRESLAAIDGERRPLPTAEEVDVVPLIVSTYGRTGSTWLMRLFDQHPATLAYRPFEYEPRTISYWLSILHALSKPASYLQPLATNFDSDHWWLGDANVPTQLPRPDEAVEDQLARSGVEDVAVLCRERIRMFYDAVAVAQGKANPRYFVEKVAPQPWVWRMLPELFPSAREVVLVRDFRDMACSILAYNEKMKVTSFGRERVATDLDFIDEVAEAARNLLAHRRQHDGAAFVVRYEDLILEPTETLTAMFEFLQINSSPEAVATVLERASRDTDGMSKHRTAKDPRASVGRWRQDMDPVLQEKCAEVLDEALEEFGYESTQAALA
jgi:hypothetical protein